MGLNAGETEALRLAVATATSRMLMEVQRVRNSQNPDTEKKVPMMAGMDITRRRRKKRKCPCGLNGTHRLSSTVGRVMGNSIIRMGMDLWEFSPPADALTDPTVPFLQTG